ncbi:hypothetical protein EU527_00375 [Candidatus Thorarchaeota archaeon]|nr:MAG: hypothetical protein EU527_00375 [Candidatus Thorarchaeota archaeon]
MRLIVSCSVYLTEDVHRVQKAIENFFGVTSVEIIKKDDHSDIITTEITQANLTNIRQIVHDKRIIDAVRVRFLRNRDKLCSAIFLDKQAAFVGKLRLLDNDNEDPPLGYIELRIDFTTEPEFEKFLEWFSPPTKNGKIIV